MPEADDVIRICNEMRGTEMNTHIIRKPARFVARISRVFLDSLEKYRDFYFQKSRVALFAPIIRAYLSHSNCKNIYDCRSSNNIPPPSVKCQSGVDLTQIMRGQFVFG